MSKGKTAKGTAIKQIEMRRCVACRQVRHKSELIRFIKTADGISIDTTGKAHGRGGNVTLHPVNAPERCDKSENTAAPKISIDTTGKAHGRGGNVTLHPVNAPERCDKSENTAAPEISIDTTGKLDGRGAYVCKSLECAESLKKRRNLDRVFRVKVPTELYDTIKEIVLM